MPIRISSEDTDVVVSSSPSATPAAPTVPGGDFAPPLASSTPGGPGVASAPTGGHGVALTDKGTLPASAAATGWRMLTADPVGALTGEFWYRTDLNQLSVQTAAGVKRTAAFV